MARNINAVPGGELMDKVKEFNGTSSHSFMWEGAGKVKEKLAPTVKLEFQAGKGRLGESVNYILSGNEVRQLWERVLSSQKLRAIPPPQCYRTVVSGYPPEPQRERRFSLDELVAIVSGTESLGDELSRQLAL